MRRLAVGRTGRREQLHIVLPIEENWQRRHGQAIENRLGSRLHHRHGENFRRLPMAGSH
jgi:hypothetical protein